MPLRRNELGYVMSVMGDVGFNMHWFKCADQKAQSHISYAHHRATEPIARAQFSFHPKK